MQKETRKAIWLQSDVHTKLKEIARIDKRTMSALIDLWADRHLKELGTHLQTPNQSSNN
jgi:predicted DNA-binding ribbon-helix-helix protein